MIIKYLNLLLIYFIIFFVKIYQLSLSPILKVNCRHLPTCSEYTITALKNHGIFTGMYFSIKRILSCHPFGAHGYDPVPKKLKKDL
tara:strand:+ start:72 stop:329 length:258 start_codon:yes stop_codon:yes gene_type:complete